MHLCVGLAVVDDDLDGQRGAGWHARPRHAAANLEASVRAVERLALLTRQNLGERLGVRLDRVGDLVQVADALLVAERRPCGLCGLCLLYTSRCV